MSLGFPARSLDRLHTISMTRALPWIIAATFPLVACGTVAVPPSSATLYALEECPSCGVNGAQPVPVPLFWGGSSDTVNGLQPWTYGTERLRDEVNEIYVRPASPAEIQSGGPNVPLGCLSERRSRLIEVFFKSRVSKSLTLSVTLLTVKAVQMDNLRNQADADAVCAANFGQQWHAVTGHPLLDGWDGTGFWAAGHRPGDAGLEW